MPKGGACRIELLEIAPHFPPKLGLPTGDSEGEDSFRDSPRICLDYGFLSNTMEYMRSKKRAENQNMDTHLVVRLPAALKAALEKASTDDRRKLSDFVRLALEDHLNCLKKGRRK